MTMNRIALLVFDRTESIDGLADHVEHASECSFAYRHRDRAACVDCRHAAHHAVSRRHRNSSHTAFAEMLLHFCNHVDRSGHIESIRHNSQRLVNRRQVASVKFDVKNGADDLHDFADVMTVGAHVSIRRSHTVSELLLNLLRLTNWQGLKPDKITQRVKRLPTPSFLGSVL